MSQPPPFRFCYHCGSSALETKSWREVKCTGCGFRQFVTPTPTAVALVLDKAGCLLLMRRAHEPGFGKFGLPGGVIEPWQSAEEACSREVMEETGVTVPVEAWSYLGTLCNRYAFQDYTWPTLDVLFVAEIEHFDDAKVVDGEASEVVAIDLWKVAVDELAFETHSEAVRRLIAKKSEIPW